MSKQLHSHAKQFVASLVTYFEQERDAGGPLLPISAVRERTAQALKLSLRTVTPVQSELPSVSSSIEEAPNFVNTHPNQEVVRMIHYTNQHINTQKLNTDEVEAQEQNPEERFENLRITDEIILIDNVTEMTPSIAPTYEETNKNRNVLKIISALVRNPEIQFKSQQRGETDLSDEEKTKIALDVFNTNKVNFLTRFGKYLSPDHLETFKQHTTTAEREEIHILLKSLGRYHSQDKRKRDCRNRRYEALKKLIDGNKYFSDTEMMKRNPLLYNQLIGQYLSDEERRSRDKAAAQDTFVKILMEGIERDNARDFQKRQEQEEDDAMEEEDSSDEEEDSDTEEVLQAQASSSKWGEFMKDDRINKDEFYPKRNKNILITATERQLLREEFITFMHQSFLDGKDEDFDYAAVDDNEDYDNIEIVTHDEEDRYFDSEEPDDAEMAEIPRREESSEDELDIYMNALNQHPVVCALSNELQKL